MKTTWLKSLENELERLSDGFNEVKGTNTVVFINKENVSKHKKVTYANMVFDYWPLKTKKYRFLLTVWGDKLVCKFDAGSPTASPLESKLIIKSTISDAKKGQGS